MRYKNKGRCIVHKFDIKPLKSFTANMYNFIPLLQEKNDPNLSARDFSNWSRINENNRYTAKQIKLFLSSFEVIFSMYVAITMQKFYVYKFKVSWLGGLQGLLYLCHSFTCAVCRFTIILY